MSFVTWSFGGAATTGYGADLRGAAPPADTGPYNKVASITVSVNGASADYWVKPIKLEDGTAVVAPSADPRVTAGGVETGYIQIKSGESKTFGSASSKGYDPAMHGKNYFTHLLVWCQAAGTVTASQISYIAQ